MHWCQPGTYAAAGGCENCTGGQYADVAGLTACKDCPATSSSYDYPHVSCQCNTGHFCAPQGQDNILPVTFNFGGNWDAALTNPWNTETSGTNLMWSATEAEIDAEWARITGQLLLR